MSGELDGRCPGQVGKGSAENALQCEACVQALLSVIGHVSKLPVPESIHEGDTPINHGHNDASHAHEATSNDYAIHMVIDNVMVLGSIAELPVAILKASGLIRLDLPGLDFVYQKYIFRTRSLQSDSLSLPRGLTWGTVRPQDFELVKSRTQIPRKNRTLALLPSVAIFPQPDHGGVDVDPIAWCFLGVDGSLASLHVEPEWRGKGLAKMASRKLWNDGFVVFDGDEGKGEDGWLAHSDVHVDNMESRGVAKSLGGLEGWMVWWVRVDMNRLSDEYLV
jgi:hypothetical protein